MRAPGEPAILASAGIAKVTACDLDESGLRAFEHDDAVHYATEGCWVWANRLVPSTSFLSDCPRYLDTVFEDVPVRSGLPPVNAQVIPTAAGPNVLGSHRELAGAVVSVAPRVLDPGLVGHGGWPAGGDRTHGCHWRGWDRAAGRGAPGAPDVWADAAAPCRNVDFFAGPGWAGSSSPGGDTGAWPRWSRWRCCSWWV